jgi:hypothetical protein
MFRRIILLGVSLVVAGFIASVAFVAAADAAICAHCSNGYIVFGGDTLYTFHAFADQEEYVERICGDEGNPPDHWDCHPEAVGGACSTHHGSTNCGGGGELAGASPSEVRRLLAAFDAGDGATLRRFVQMRPTAVKLNEKRHALQILNCGGGVIASLPIGDGLELGMIVGN